MMYREKRRSQLPEFCMMFQVDDIYRVPKLLQYTLPSRWKAPKLEDACYSTIYIHLSSTQFFLMPGTNVYQMHQVYDHDTQGIDDSILRSAGLSGLWCTRSPLRKCRQMKRYVFSSFRPVFGCSNKTYFEEFFEADFRILFKYRLLWRHGIAWEVPFPPRHPFRPWPLKRAHLQLHNPMNLPPHAWDMWRDGASRRPPER